jgi:hypothetical protein
MSADTPIPTRGYRITVEDLETGESRSQILVDDVVVFTHGSCYVDGVQHWPAAGTSVWTVKGSPRAPLVANVSARRAALEEDRRG